MGGTDVVITGSGFLPNSSATMDGVLLIPNGGSYVDEHILSGHVPPHQEGRGVLTVHTPLGDPQGVLFQYLPPPQISDINPKVGAMTGGASVAISGKNFSQQTTIYFGTSLASALPLAATSRTDTLIVGNAPSGNGRTTVWAFDPDLGFTKLDQSFVWETP